MPSPPTTLKKGYFKTIENLRETTGNNVEMKVGAVLEVLFLCSWDKCPFKFWLDILQI